ncbi:IclR family transcriptional regulator [Rhodococcus sp. USK13]|uniref:IclR family transcriptional regulator n=1 Tax=Rhodococcus sp. USK13 TaxID=2806442 RepID=UPI001BCBD14A|nr:IclR family transcriptional regulator [Rhodococcus sp. USK13]
MGSVDNALQILRLVGKAKSVRVVEVASYLGVSRSTAHRLLDALGKQGFVTKDAAHVYRIGPAFAGAGLAGDSLPDWQLGIHSHLRELASRSGETCHVGVLEGNSARFIEGVSSEKLPRVGSRVGILLPAHATAIGKAILSEMSAENVRGLFPFGLPGSTASAPTEPAKMLALHRELVATRRRGYAINVGEIEAGVIAVGAPVHEKSGRTVGAIAVAAPTARVPRIDVEKLAVHLMDTVNAIESNLASRHEGLG